MRKVLFAAFCLCISFNLTAQCLEGDCQNGLGTLQLENGSKYVGDFKKGLPNGRGTIYLANGNRYNGDWAAGVREGMGVYTLVSGDVYTGAFKQNRFNGQGTMTFSSGDKYTGNWENDRPNGQGIYVFKNNDRYEGNFKNGSFDGKGAIIYASGDKYIGEWRQNKRHGKGKLVQSDGTVVEGTWNNGIMAAVGSNQNNTNTNESKPNRDCNSVFCNDGTGFFLYADGSRWEGTFNNGIPEGEGTCFYANGDKYVGKFSKHAPHGAGKMYYQNGRNLAAIWEYGRPIGELTQVDTKTKVKIDENPDVKIWAVVVGVGRYNSMPVLKFSDDDAYHFYAFLKSPEGGALPDNQVKVLVDDDASRVNVLQTMRSTLLQADENDVVIFYFSGHGLEGSFLPFDYDGMNNKLYHSEIKSILEQSKARHKICVADACHSGSLLAAKTPVNDQLRTFYRAFEESEGGTALIMSSKSTEYSLEDHGLRSGIFSHFLIKGLKGQADFDGNHIVTVKETFDYLYRNVREYTSNAQTPTISGKFDNNMPVSIVRN